MAEDLKENEVEEFPPEEWWAFLQKQRSYLHWLGFRRDEVDDILAQTAENLLRVGVKILPNIKPKTFVKEKLRYAILEWKRSEGSKFRNYGRRGRIYAMVERELRNSETDLIQVLSKYDIPLEEWNMVLQDIFCQIMPWDDHQPLELEDTYKYLPLLIDLEVVLKKALDELDVKAACALFYAELMGIPQDILSEAFRFTPARISHLLKDAMDQMNKKIIKTYEIWQEPKADTRLATLFYCHIQKSFSQIHTELLRRCHEFNARELPGSGKPKPIDVDKLEQIVEAHLQKKKNSKKKNSKKKIKTISSSNCPI